MSECEPGFGAWSCIRRSARTTGQPDWMAGRLAREEQRGKANGGVVSGQQAARAELPLTLMLT